MILRDRIQILEEVIEDAKELLRQYKEFSEVSAQSLLKLSAYVSDKAADPKEILDMHKRVHDMQMQSLTMFNTILEKFPVEHTVQELQLLEIFRNLTEAQKKSLMAQLETLILQKRKR